MFYWGFFCIFDMQSKTSMMKVKVKYNKNEERLVNIPQEFIGFQKFNYRVIIGIFPQKAEWCEEGIYELKIIKIEKNTIIRTNLSVNVHTLQHTIDCLGKLGQSEEDRLKGEVVNYLINYFKEDQVSKDLFISIFNKSFDELNQIIYDH